MQRLLLLGLNHTTAPLEVREKLAFSTAQARAAVLAFRERFPNAEAVLLSTCNRVELYVGRQAHSHLGLDDLIAFYSDFHNIDPTQFRDHLYHKAGREVVEHLFTVASSLDSIVLGETQILGQVRDSYDAAKEIGAAGAQLNPLFQRALAVGKQVMTSTSLNEGRLSVASVAVDSARRIFEQFGDKTILNIGAGKMATLVLQGFAALSPGRLLVCNRDPTKAQTLAERFNGQQVPFDKLSEHLVQADIVVSSTGATYPLITRKLMESLLRQRRYRPIFLIDIAVPRDVEASVGELEQVYLYNVDDLQAVVSGTLAQRQGAIDAATAIVDKHVGEYAVWHRQREMGPIIDRLFKRYHKLAKEELERTMNKMPGISPAERSTLEEMTRRLVNKLLHSPISTLRSMESPHTGVSYLHAMEKLFDLESTDDAPTDPPEAPDGGTTPDGTNPS